jgi:hypothetical protein
MELSGQFQTKNTLPPRREPRIPTGYTIFSTENASYNILNGCIGLKCYLTTSFSNHLLLWA